MVNLPPPAQARAAAAEQLAAAGRIPEAVAAYERLLLEHPGYADAWYNLGRLRRRLGRFEDALAAYGRALAAGIARPEEVHLNRGVIFADDLRDPPSALAELGAALGLNPGYAPALHNLANLHEDLGQREAARETYLRLLALHPEAAEPLARLAQLEPPGSAGATALRSRLQDRLRDPEVSFAERASLGFALARLLDGAGDYPGAFAAALEANRASRLSVSPPARYDRLGQERFTDDLIRSFTEPLGAPASENSMSGPRPVFICGMFRSGSTLAEQILAGHPGVRAAGELELLPYLVNGRLRPFPGCIPGTDAAVFAELATAYRAGLARLGMAAGYVTDKRPENFLLIGLIKKLFPAARIVHTTREALDTCLSIFFLHADPRLSYALDLDDIGHYYLQYQRLMAHWRGLFGPDILDFNYDSLVREPRTTVAALLDFLGLEWHDRVLDFTQRAAPVRTASVWQVREGLYQGSSGRAHHYAPQLARLAQSLDRARP